MHNTTSQEMGAMMKSLVIAALLSVISLSLANADTPTVNIQVDFSQRQDIPLFKKYAVMNSGLVASERYNDSVLESFGLIRASAFVSDLYMGTSNQNASFGQAITGALGSASANGVVYNLTELERVTTGLGQYGVIPYWAITYAPTPFQPTGPSTAAWAQAEQLAQCIGYVGISDHYQCRPAAGVTNSLAGFDDCWKCPPKDANGQNFTEYSAMLAEFVASNAKTNVTVYNQIWNEPDLTNWFNYSAGGTSFFAGTAADYNAMYAEGSVAMLAADPDVVVGGPGVAYWIQTDPVLYPNDMRTSGTYFAEKVSNSSLPLDFFSFHAIAACTDGDCDVSGNGGQLVFQSRAETARYALTDPPAGVNTSPFSFNTTQIHCTEYFGGTTADSYYLPYTASTDLGVVMLNNFLAFLDQTDVTQVTWAQYMDITCCNGTGLLDYYGNARPSWHTFRFWGDIPTERVQTNISDTDIVAVSGYSPRLCHGGVLFWNNASTQYTSTVNISNIPYENFTVQVYVLDANHQPGPGYSLDPYITYTQQASTNGTWSFPPPGQVDFVLLGQSIVYLNISASDCSPANPVPSGRILSTLHNFSFRPFQTFLYGEFDTSLWSAYIGMGNETNGTAMAGAKVLIPLDTTLNISMTFWKVAPPPNTPPFGVRIDFWDATSNSYPANSSIQFYQTGTQAGAQIPQLYGSKQDVPLSNFYYVNLASFIFDPLDNNYPTPEGWNGKLSIVFFMQNGPLYSSAYAYITEQPAISQIATAPISAVAG